MSIVPDKISFIELVSASSNTTFKVPDFQRTYVWKTADEVEEFWQDIDEHFIDIHKNKSKTGLFLGNLILCKPNENSESYQIIDGQQRLTTIFILLIAFRTFLINLPKGDKEREIQNIITIISGSLSFQDVHSGKMEGSRFTAAPSISLILNHMSSQDWDGQFPDKIGRTHIKRQCNRIRPIYNYFLTKIQEKITLDNYSSFNKTINTLSFIKITLNDFQEAYLFFERTNARGKNLEVGDLLKAHLFASHPDEKDIVDIWDQIVIRSNNQLTRMLKYFYITQNGHITSSKLFKGLKDLYEEESDKNERVTKLVLKLEDFSYFFDAVYKIKDDQKLIPIFEKLSGRTREVDKIILNKIYHAVDALNLFGITQATPLLWSFINKFYELKLNDNKRHKNTLVDFFENLENYHFINNCILDRVGNEVEKLYASYARDFSSVKSDFEFTSTLQEFYGNLKNKIAPEETFIAEFSDIEYVVGSNTVIYYIFDRFNNILPDGSKVSPSDRQKIYHAYIPYKRTDIEIEHWFPRSKARDEKTNKVLPWCNNIGNLMALPRIPNNKLGDLDPQQKYEKLVENPELNTFNHNKRFFKESAPFDDWDQESIKQRANELASEAYNKVWKFDPSHLEPQ